MVQLRVDVEAARARAEFNATNRSVRNLGDGLNAAQRQADQLGDELTVATARAEQAVRVFEAAEQAADDAADEMHRLRQQVDALGNAAPQALVEQLRQAEDHLRDMEREEQRLRDAMEDATHEQNRLNRAFDDGGDEVRRITRELALAQVEAARLRRIMDDANRRAANPLRGAQRGLLGFRRQLDNALRLNGNGLRNSLREAWNTMPIELKLAIVGAGVGMATILAGAIGAVLNAALLSVVGLGVLGAVVAVAAKTSSAVRTAFSDTFAPIGDEIAAFARDVAEGPLIKAAEIFGQTWEDIATDVQGAFADVGKHIEPLAAGLAQLVENVMPGLREGLKAAGPVLDELAAALPAIGTAISDMFHDLTRDGGAQGAVKGMRVLAATVIAVFRTIGAVVGWLSRQFNTTTMFVADMLTLLSKIPGIGKLFEGAASSARDFANAGSGTGRSLEETGVAADQTASAMRRQGDATNYAARAAQDLSAKMAHIIDVELGAKDAAIQFEAALDAITESAKENGRSLDIGTEKGRTNASTILDGVRAAEAKRQADIEMAGGVNASAAAVGAANAQYEAMVAKLRAAAYAAGFNKAQVDALIGSLGRIPANIKTTYTIEYRTVGNIPKDQRVGVGNVKGYASGTTSAPAGWAWVGEKGPELMRFKGGEQVLNSMESARAMGARSGTRAASPGTSGGGGSVVGQLTLGGSRGTGLEALFRKWLDDAFASGRIKYKVVNGRVAPV
jgi:hypothetical protein